MSWLFGDTYIQQSMDSVEIKVIAGVTVGLFGLIIVYGALKIHNKYLHAKMEKTARREVQMNNIQSV